MVFPVTLRQWLERKIKAGDQSDIGPRRWKAELLRFLLAEFDAENRR